MTLDFIMWDVVEEHLDEAAFLFEQWSSALYSPLYDLAELASGPEARMFAHLDGLRAGGPTVRERLLVPTVADPTADEGAVFVAAYLLLEAGDGDECDAVFGALEDAEHERWTAMVRALELVSREGLDARLRWELDACSPAGLAGRLHGLACHNGQVDARVLAWLRAEDPAIVRAACHLARRVADPSLLAALRASLGADDSELQREALDTACVSCPAQIWAEVRVLAEHHQHPLRARARMWAALLGDASVHAHLIHTAQPEPGDLRALGFCGRPRAVELALEHLDDDTLGPVAGELLRTITDLPADDDYWIAASFVDDEDDDEDDETEALDETDVLEAEELVARVQGEAELARPRPDAIRSWWSEARTRFEPRGRYLGGVPLHRGAPVTEALARSSCRQRHPLALELAARTQARGRLDTRAFSARQRQQLAILPPVKLDSGLP